MQALRQFLDDERWSVAQPPDQLDPLHLQVLRGKLEWVDAERLRQQLLVKDSAGCTALHRAWHCKELVQLGMAAVGVRQSELVLWLLLAAQLLLYPDGQPLPKLVEEEMERVASFAGLSIGGEASSHKRAAAVVMGLEVWAAQPNTPKKEVEELHTWINPLVEEAIKEQHAIPPALRELRRELLSEQFAIKSDGKSQASLLLQAAVAGNLNLISILLGHLSREQLKEIALRDRLMALAASHPACAAKLPRLLESIVPSWNLPKVTEEVCLRVKNVKTAHHAQSAVSPTPRVANVASTGG